MARARYQVLVIPYCIQDDQVQFCLFRRSDMGIWQFIAGGGEEEDLSIIASAKREAFEEAGISKSCDFFKLNTCCSIPTNCFKNAETIWGKACFVIPEYAFAVRVESTVLQLSHEHTEYNWLKLCGSTHTTSIRQQQNRAVGTEPAHCAWNVGIEHFHYVAIFQGRVPCQDGATPPCTNSIKITVFCQKPISFEIGFFLLPAAAHIFYYPEYCRNVRKAGACNFAPFCVPW